MTGHEIVDAIECLALRFCGAFAWRLEYIVLRWSDFEVGAVVRHPFLLFLSSFLGI